MLAKTSKEKEEEAGNRGGSPCRTIGPWRRAQTIPMPAALPAASKLSHPWVATSQPRGSALGSQAPLKTSDTKRSLAPPSSHRHRPKERQTLTCVTSNGGLGAEWAQVLPPQTEHRLNEGVQWEYRESPDFLLVSAKENYLKKKKNEVHANRCRRPMWDTTFWSQAARALEQLDGNKLKGRLQVKDKHLRFR